MAAIRSTTASAITTSSQDMPELLNTTGRSGASVTRPVTTSAIGISASRVRAESAMASTTSPDSRNAVTGSSTITWARAISGLSSSRRSGSCEPTAMTTTSGRSRVESNSGVAEPVAQTTTPAARSASVAAGEPARTTPAAGSGLRAT